MSGAGKSTVAGIVADELRTTGYPVEVLDGDVVRANLSSELGYSREDRDTNVRRIGWVCELLARHGVIVVVAAISPYRATRDDVLGRLGRVVQVHITAPLDLLEARDVKGLYRRARAGEIAQFTGIDDAYEPPLDADVEIHSDGSETPQDGAARILERARSKGYLA